MRTSKEYLFVYLKGIAMGAADLVPGVSGGTIALITGIYEELIATLAGFNTTALHILRRRGLRAAWRQTNAGFLLTVLGGIATAVLTFSQVIHALLKSEPLLVSSFFFGLVLASLGVLLAQIPKWNAATVIAVLIGVTLSVWLVFLPPRESTEIPLGLVFLYGMLAICAMILPGISGSFILVLLGAYSFMLDALSDLHLAVIAVFAGGALLGIVLFSRILKSLFTRFHVLTLALLSGFVSGSLVKIWPWRHPDNSFGALDIGLYPLLMIVLGAGLVLGLAFAGKRRPYSNGTAT